LAPSSPTILPLPAHYDPANAAAWSYHPDQAELFAAATAWRERHQIPPSSQERVNVHLLLVDCQIFFPSFWIDGECAH
jgi:hypothetical protein